MWLFDLQLRVIFAAVVFIGHYFKWHESPPSPNVAWRWRTREKEGGTDGGTEEEELENLGWSSWLNSTQ